ncbi:hypothetical protein C7M61_003161 [Candidozyma pseudohaemuli]|uniref:ADP-ribose 1''-phosphate phosphatase n=1 Tax=Candidozyma pseudohaemuli TaxID=418784 RepID=A0A2P7YPM0_9ASCO|nr:hypothetical protein C7M61_003161 [[Candida] pseudohaemulonii]PSK37911.1 hypothetical protein C7M61_003161 [[Candida] pseudohaemulonii]
MLNYIKGDLFNHNSVKKAILAHACNPHGSWGGGIAAQFRKRYPDAYTKYAEHCKQNGPLLLGTAYVIPVEDKYVACLFTSNFENSVGEIVEYTRQSLGDLAGKLGELGDVEEDQTGRPVVNMPKINSGIFNVPWEETEKALLDADILVNVYEF